MANLPDELTVRNARPTIAELLSDAGYPRAEFDMDEGVGEVDITVRGDVPAGVLDQLQAQLQDIAHIGVKIRVGR